ncbi:MAG: ABC transporter ATP-binding protein [Alphaproteobacteria bacterium]|nr:ABC transporter ATP-binding protein [Alphaproteobacteria bacterium]
MIKVKNLDFTYHKAAAPTLHGMSFEIAKGEIMGFLGPSGAGKSTTQNILIGMLKNYAGSIEIMGRELSDWGKDFYEHIGVSFELPNHFLKLTARENLEHFSSLYSGDKHDVMEVMDWVDLADDADKKVSNFSKGMKIRLNVARSLIHKPIILFLDEPTSGLDPVNAAKIKKLAFNLRDEGTTIFITTHNMTLADQMCDRVAFVTDGHLRAIDKPSNFKKQYGKRFVDVEYMGAAQKPEIANFAMDGLGENKQFFELLNSGQHIETIHSEETTLENVFIELTGQELDA